jgi:hypothetical protein
VRGRVATAVGVVSVLLGFAGLAGFAVPGLNATYAFVLAVGVLAGLLGLRYALARRKTDQFTTSLGDPESRYRVAAPGDDVDEDMTAPGGWGRGGSPVRPRIRDAVVQTLVLRENCSVEAADDRIEAGTWTDDPIAARYLGADVPVSLSTRIRFLVRSRGPAARAARTIAAVERLRTETDSALPSDDDGGDEQ